MASLNTLKTKFGFLISGLIAVVLVIFALNIDSNTFVDQPTDDEINGPAVFTIAGEEVKHIEYARLRDLYSSLQILNPYTGNVADMGHELGAVRALHTLVYNNYAAPAFAGVGVYATDAEVEAQAIQNFRDLRAQYASFGISAEQIDQILQIIWSSEMYFGSENLAVEKFKEVMAAGLYLNKLEIAQALRNDSLSFDGVYVEIPYATIKDADVEVTEEEIAAYYEANRKENPKYDSRGIRYVRFERQPSEEDKAAIEAEVKALDAKVKELADDVDGIKAAVRAAGGKVQSYYTAYDKLQKEYADAFKSGKAYGPELKANVWTARYLLADVNAPESYDIEAAAFESVEAAEAAVEELIANGGDFAKLQEVKDAQAQTIAFEQLPVSDTKHFLGKKAGDIFAFTTNGVATVVKINSVGASKRYVLTANLDRELVPSDDTNRAVLAQVDAFAAAMGSDVETFTAAAKEAQKPALAAVVTRADVLSGQPTTVQGIANSSNIANWVLGAQVGDTKQFVIDGVTYVVLVHSIDTEKYEARNDFAIRRKLINDKKYAMIAAKAATLADAKAIEGAKEEKFAGVKFADNTPDAHLVGAIVATTETGKVAQVKGTNAVYVFVVNKINGEVDPASYATERIPLTEKATSDAYKESIYNSFLKKAEIKDHRTDMTF